MDLELKDKIAVVTGSSRGLGLASAQSLAKEGCYVCLCARGQAQLDKAEEAVNRSAGSSDRVLAVRADLTKPSDLKAVIEKTVMKFGGLDVLINNVGKAGGGGILDTSDDEWQSALDETLYPAIRASRFVVPHMRKRGGGVIVMIASIWGRESGGRMTYNVVKAGEISLAKSLAQQLACDNIRVNSVAPGSISFPGGSWHRRQQEDPQGMAEFIKLNLPFGRFGHPEEVGDLVAFLSSARASWISGATVTVDGCQSRSLI
ncbi:MAG: short-chain dehydrogenase [Rhodospirillaceae bacterium]|nr:short-chain dehydrogenase [Rhodospirillaceae bacterium]